MTDLLDDKDAFKSALQYNLKNLHRQRWTKPLKPAHCVRVFVMLLRDIFVLYLQDFLMIKSKEQEAKKHNCACVCQVRF